MNFTSSDLALLADTDYLTVRCSFSYFAASHWIPHVQCLPNIAGQTEETNETSESITYTKSFSATPHVNDVVINCTAKFNYTSSDEAYNTPTDVNLWQSPSLHVQCRQRLSTEISRVSLIITFIRIAVKQNSKASWCRFGLVVTHWSVLMKSLYARPS